MSRSQSTPQSSQMIWLESRIEQLEAENEQLSLYKNLADEYGLVVFADLAELQKQRDELLAALEKIATKCNHDMHGDDGSLGGYAFGIWQTAHAAIASVKEPK